MTEHTTISFDSYLALILRHKWIILFCMFVCLGSSAAIYLATPKLFKATTEITVQSGFFQNPLVNDVLPEIHEVGELNAVRESFLRKTLSDEFIDTLGTKFNIYESVPNTRARGRDRMIFSRRIEAGRQGSGYFIAVINEDPEKSFAILEEIKKRLLDELYSYHTSRLKNAADVIEKRVNTLSKVLEQAGDEKLIRTTENQLTEVQAKIRALRKKFTTRHPAVRKLKAREQELMEAMKKLVPENPVPVPSDMTIDSVNRGGQTNRAMYGELVEKLSKLKILLDMDGDDNLPPNVSIVRPPKTPEQPFKPRKERYLGVGFLLGLILSAVAVFARERQSFTTQKIDDVLIADILDIPCLGSLVELERKAQQEEIASASLPHVEKEDNSAWLPPA